MKIVHLIGYFQPEFGYKEYYIARNQVKAGHEVHIISSNKVVPLHNFSMLTKKLNLPPSRDRGPESLGTTELDGIKIHRLPDVFEIKDFILVKGVKNLLKEIRPDIVHTYAPEQGTPLFGALYKKSFGYFLISEDQILPETNKPYKSFLGTLRYHLMKRWLGYLYFGGADVVFLPNPDSKEYFESQYKISHKTKLVPIGFEPEFFFFNAEEREKIRRKYGVSKDEFLIVSASRLTGDKGFADFFKAGQRLFRERPLKMLIVGDGDNKTNLESQVKSLGLQEKIKFPGFIPERELYRYYSAGDLALWSKRPTVGISNAIGCSVPVLLPQSGFFSHLVRFGNGLTFEKDNFKDLVDKLENLLDDKKTYAELKKNTEKAREYLNFRNLAQVDIEVFNERKKAKQI